MWRKTDDQLGSRAGGLPNLTGTLGPFATRQVTAISVPITEGVYVCTHDYAYVLLHAYNIYKYVNVPFTYITTSCIKDHGFVYFIHV